MPSNSKKQSGGPVLRTSDCADSIDVLCVDDEPGFAEMTAEYLERENDRFRTDTATGAEEGLDRLSTTGFDCVVSDYDMPGKNGITFLRAIRAEFPDIPFVLFTGKGNEEIASEAIAAGVTDYLQKQMGVEQYELLANRVHNAVEQYRAKTRADELQRIRTLVAEINQGLVRSTSREEIQAVVCETIVDTEPYAYAWFGTPAPDTNSVEVNYRAGEGRDYADAVEITTDESPTGRGPTGRAARSREIVVTQDIEHADEFGPWRENALERGFRSSAAIPLVYDDNLQSLLNIYSTEVDGFDERELEILQELGDDIAQALHHQELQRSLRRERDRFHHLVDGIEHYAIFMMDRNGDVATWNRGAERIKGYTADEIIGDSYGRFFPTDARERGEPTELLSRVERNESVQGQGWRVRKDGDRFWADFTLTALYDESDDLRGFAKVTEDKTDVRRYEQQLRAQNDRLEKFTSIVSHDLKSPLNVVEGRLELAQEECTSDHLDAAANALERGLTMVDEVLALARGGEGTTQPEAVDLAQTVTWCWQTIDTADATLAVETDQTVVAVSCRLKQILVNLLANAVKHGGSSVTVTVGELDDGFYVADDGVGISEEKHELIFEGGYSSNDGTGLGLGIVDEGVTAHGWNVRVTDSESGGARFEVTGVEFAAT